MNMEITIVKTFCDFGHNFFKKQPFWPFLSRILTISYKKKSGNPGTKVWCSCDVIQIYLNGIPYLLLKPTCCKFW